MYDIKVREYYIIEFFGNKTINREASKKRKKQAFANNASSIKIPYVGLVDNMLVVNQHDLSVYDVL
jgi:hypothetical protein